MESLASCVNTFKVAGRTRSVRSEPFHKSLCTSTFRANFVNAVHFRRGLTCTVRLGNDLNEGGAKNGF